jgi:hypothetical protein
MSTTTRSQPKTDRLLSLLIGVFAGILLSCCLGGGTLMLAQSSGSPATTTAAQPPANYDIEIIVEEDYINRTMVENASNAASSLPLAAGHLDIRPGGLADFTAQIEAGPLRPVFDGTLEFRTTDAGQLDIRFASVRAGYLPVTAFVPASQADAINLSINKMFAERAGPLNLRVAGVTSDETTLRFYLVIVQ